MTDTAFLGGNSLRSEQSKFVVRSLDELSDPFAVIQAIDRQSLKGMPHLKIKNAANVLYEVKDPLYVESSFVVHERMSDKAVGYCIAHVQPSLGRSKESLFKVHMIAAIPGSMAGAAIMGEILERMNQHELPVEFIALSDTTGKILRRKTAREALERSGWDLTVLQGPGQVRHEPLPYRSELIRLERRSIES